MKFRYTGQTVCAAILFSLLLLGGCGEKSGFPTMGPRFHPIDGKVASMESRNAGNSTELLCKVGRGQAHFGKKWLSYEEAQFGLTPQSRVNVTLAPRRGKGDMTLQAFFDAEGQRLLFCPMVEGAPGTRVSCASLYALEDDLQMGIKRTFDIPNALRGGVITCAYKKENLRKL